MGGGEDVRGRQFSNFFNFHKTPLDKDQDRDEGVSFEKMYEAGSRRPCHSHPRTSKKLMFSDLYSRSSSESSQKSLSSNDILRPRPTSGVKSPRSHPVLPRPGLKLKLQN